MNYLDYIANQHKYIDAESFEQLTDKQREAFDMLLKRWSIIKTPFRLTGIGPDKYLFGEVGYSNSDCSMWIGIESDGYTHS